MNITPQQASAWENVKDSLKQHLQKVSYELWIEPISLQKLTDTTIYLTCKEFYVIDHVNRRYLSEIAAAIAAVFGRTYTIDLSVEDFEPIPEKNTGLNPAYTFDRFVVGPSNSFAYAAARAVAEQPSEVYNPLFIYGSVGLGKTHLMNAIGNFILTENPEKVIMMTTAEKFTNELIDSIVKKKDASALRERMRGADVLMVDDIQFLSKTKATQEEFFHTFNELHNAHKQIILSSDRPPKEIPTIEERLRSRFEWGLIVDIGKPDYETRVAILRKKAAEGSIQVSDEVIEYIAGNVKSNIRELEGSLTRLHAQCQLLGKSISLTTAKESLSQLMRARDIRHITPEIIIGVVSEQYGLTPEDIRSKKRSREIALPRQIAMYLCRDMTSLSTTSIGLAFGSRDHTTVLHGCEKIAADMKNDFAFAKRVEELSQLIRNS